MGSFLATRGPHHNAHGRAIGVFGITRDITELRRMEQALSEISEREQQRIGQDLHDGICQRLAGIGLLAGVLKSKLAEKSLAETADAAEIARLLEETTAESRSVARGLFQLHPGPHGLMISLYELAESTERLFKIPCSLECEEPVFVEDSTTAVHLYRIAQEAVNNAVKHSGCSRIKIVLGETDGTISLAVHDDGSGIRPSRSASRGLGTHIMNYRARMIGGKVEVRSGSQGGTSVICLLPRKTKPHS
jgi:signal transduction histidine kinase